MFTDMVGSTQLAQRDEKAALKLLREQEELAQPVLASHHGRLVKSTGDGMLVEFGNALEAIQCAVEFQRQVHERESRNDEPALRVRVGIHIGDVEDRGADIFGDSVNVAARVEPLADPGGICLSSVVWEHVRNKTPYAFEKLGPRSLKGVLGPVEVYRVVLPWTVHGTPPAGDGPARLAVLPFANMSPDPADVFFADGLTEELITVVSQLHELRVVARTSVMQYKSTTQDVSQIGAHLGVSWILEGSVRRAGNRLRITAQLIDVSSQAHAWSKSYDREIDDVFAVQSEIAKQVADALKIELRPNEVARLATKPPVHMDSYLAYLKGRSVLESEWSEKNFRAAKRQFEIALSLDPSNARAHSGLADSIMSLKWGRFRHGEDEGDSVIRDHVVQALALDPQLAEAHSSLGDILWDEAKHLDAEKEYQLALSLNPSYAPAHYTYAHLLLTFNRPDASLKEMVLAEQLDPNSVTYLNAHVWLLIMLRRLDEAASHLERLRELNREGRSYLGTLGFYYYARGDLEKTSRNIARLAEYDPEEAINHRIWLLAATGRKDEARKLIAEQEARKDQQNLGDFAMWHALVGDLDECFRLLNKAWDTKSFPIQSWRIEPTFEAVRRDPRFGQLLKRMDLPP